MEGGAIGSRNQRARDSRVKEVREIAEIIAAYILGFATGIFVYRHYIISTIIGKSPTTKCDYCQYMLITRGEPFRQKKKEEKAQ